MIKPEGKKMKAIIYCRVSTEEQVKGYSLDFQEKQSLEYAERNGFEVLKVFVEEGESAKVISRTKLTELLNFCKENIGQIDVLIVHKLDRFARNQQDHQAIRAILAQYGVILRSATEPIDDTPVGKLMENFLSSIAQFDNDIRAERVTLGMKEKLKQGLWAFVAPLGYKNVVVNKVSTIVPDEKIAHLIKRLFEEYATGLHTYESLANFMTKLGLRTKKGSKLSKQTIQKILVNKLYVGIIDVPSLDIVDIEGKFEAIISKDPFYKVQRLREGKGFTQEHRLRIHPDFILRRSLLCPKCRKSLTGSWSKGKSKRYAYYHCTTKGCPLRSIPKKDIDKTFLALLKATKPTGEYIKLFKEVVREVWQKKYDEKFKEVKRLEYELAQIRELKDALIEQNAKRVLEDNDFKEKIRKVNDEIAHKELVRNEARTDEVDIELVLNLAETILTNVSIIWLEAPLEHKVRFQQLLYPKGVIYNNGVIGTLELGLPFKIISEARGEKSEMVGKGGLEPPRLYSQRILSPSRIPVPPLAPKLLNPVAYTTSLQTD